MAQRGFAIVTEQAASLLLFQKTAYGKGCFMLVVDGNRTCHLALTSVGFKTRNLKQCKTTIDD